MAVYKSGAHAFRDRCHVTSFQIISTTNITPTDASVPIGRVVLWFDSTGGAAHLKYKAKDAAGTVTTGNIF